MTADWLWLDTEGVRVFEGWDDERPEQANPAIGGWIDRDKWLAAQSSAAAERAAINRWRMLQSRMAPGGKPEGFVSQRQIDDVILEAEVIVADAFTDERMPFCLAVCSGEVAGDPLTCTLPQGHSEKIRHKNHKTGFCWWG